MTLSSPIFILVSLPTMLPSTVGDDTAPIGNVDPATVAAGWCGGPGVGPGWTGVAVAAAVMVPLITAPTLSIRAIFAQLSIFENCKHLTNIQVVSDWTPLVWCLCVSESSPIPKTSPLYFNRKWMLLFLSILFIYNVFTGVWKSIH